MLFVPTALVAEDEELLIAVRRLDPRALTLVHNRYYSDIYRYLLFKTGDDHAADDLSSEVFMRLLTTLRSGRPPKSLRAWLFGVANHLAADHFRQQARRRQSDLPEDLADTANDLDVEVMHGLTMATVRQALAQLTDEQQQVLALRFGEGRSIIETALMLDKSETAVKQLQFRAIAAMRRLMDGVNV
jgi:RNA polymerase sigma-70 factor (ECF subfamily)